LPLVFDTNATGDLQYVATTLSGEASPENLARHNNGHAVMGTFTDPSGGTVFNAGAADWVMASTTICWCSGSRKTF
jgi:hypothetical protein